MTECRTPEIQDLLPDYVSESLDATAAAMVERHLSICDPCRDDIAVLRLARVVRPKTDPLDVARIVANLPRPTPTLRLVRPSDGTMPVTAAVNPVAVSGSRRSWSASVWQVAAAVGVMVVGGTSVLVSRNSPSSVTSARSGEAQLADAAESALSRSTPSSVGLPTAAVAVLDSPSNATSSGRLSRVSVSYGDLGDYSQAELQRMLDRLEKWDGTSSTEPLPTLPVVSTSGGSTP